MISKENTALEIQSGKPALKLDFGCGLNKLAGFHGVDAIDFKGVDTVLDLRQTPWPWEDESVEEAHSSHFIEHLDGSERVVFFNELFRVLQWGAIFRMICPYWAHDRAFGDPTHKWPPIGGWFALYLNKAWRDGNAPHCGYTCDFDCITTAISWDSWLNTRHDEVKSFAMQRYVNSLADITFNLQKTRR